jgi:hypothetical protein
MNTLPSVRPHVLVAVLRLSFAVLVAGLMLTGCAANEPQPDATAGDARAYPTDEVPMSSIALIDAAQSAGMLDHSTALLYKVYVMFDPDSLPPEFRSDVPSKCGTPVILEVQRNWHLLAPEDRLEISQYIQPLGEPGSTDTGLDDVTPDRLDRERDGLD